VHKVDRQLLAHIQRGSYLINYGTADLVDAFTISHALDTGRPADCSGALTTPPSPARGLTRLLEIPAAGSTATLSAQNRYAAGTRKILEAWYAGRPIRADCLLLQGDNPRPI
jgi:formate dehydrogenase